MEEFWSVLLGVSWYLVAASIAHAVALISLFTLIQMLFPEESTQKIASWILTVTIAGPSIWIGLSPFFARGIEGYVSGGYFGPIEGIIAMFLLIVTGFTLWLRGMMFDAN